MYGSVCACECVVCVCVSMCVSVWGMCECVGVFLNCTHPYTNYHRAMGENQRQQEEKNERSDWRGQKGEDREDLRGRSKRNQKGGGVGVGGREWWETAGGKTRVEDMKRR